MTKYVKPTPPRSSSAAFSEIKRIIKMGWVDLPDQKSYRGSGAPGRMLEHLVGVDENNADSPDLMDWELKFHGGTAPITLFHKDPEPRGIMRFMVHEYGWEDDKGRISFRHTIAGESDRGFKVVNDVDRVVVRNKFKDNAVPHWKHNTLLNAAGAKLRRLILVHGQVDKAHRRVKYNSAYAYWDINLLGLCDAMQKGIILVDFDARTQQGPGTALRNHGTKFRVHSANIGALYDHSVKIV